MVKEYLMATIILMSKISDLTVSMFFKEGYEI